MEKEHVFHDVKWAIKIESVQNFVAQRSEFVHDLQLHGPEQKAKKIPI
jgi:hypothetical protein